jgi:hypothetical protein
LRANPGPPAMSLSRSPSPGEGTTKVPLGQKEPRVMVKIRDSPPRKLLPEGSTLHRSHWRLLSSDLRRLEMK